MPTIKGFKVGDVTYSYMDENIAPEFSTTKTYSVGEYVINPDDGFLYRCHTAVTTKGSWTGTTNWTKVTSTNNIDTTLSSTGMAADAKITGDKNRILTNALSYASESIENNIEALTGNRVLVFNIGRYKASTAPATGVSVQYELTEDFVCTISECDDGDIFIADVYGHTGVTRAWYFLDSNMTIVSGGERKAFAPTNQHLQGTITAPANSKYVVFNDRLVNMTKDYYVYKGQKNIIDRETLDARSLSLSYINTIYPTIGLNLSSGNLISSGASNNNLNGIRSASNYDYLPIIKSGDFYYSDKEYRIKVGIYSSVVLSSTNFITWVDTNYQTGVIGIPPEYEGYYAAVTIKKVGYENDDISTDLSIIKDKVKYYSPSSGLNLNSIIPDVDSFYFDWKINTTILQDGNEEENSKYAVTNMIPVKSGNIIYNTTTGIGKDGYNTIMMIATYFNNVYQAPRKEIEAGKSYIIPKDCDGIRLIYGYTSNNAPAMTRNLLDEYFSVRFMKSATPMDYRDDGERPYYYAFGASTTVGAVHHYSGESITYSKYKYPEYVGKILGLKTFNLGKGSTGLIERGNSNNIMDQIYTNGDGLSKASLITLMFAYGNDSSVGNPKVTFPIGEYDDYYPYDKAGYNIPGEAGINEMINKGATLFGCLNWCIRYLNQNYPFAQVIIIYGSPSANASPRTIQEQAQTEGVGVAPYKLIFGDYAENSNIRNIHNELIKLKNALNIPVIDLYFDGNAFSSYRTYAKDPQDNTKFALFSTSGTQVSPTFDTHPNDNGYKDFAKYMAGRIVSLFNH